MVDVSVTGLVKSYDLEKNILDGLTFQIERGERVGLLGKNGAGKTTLFRILTGESSPDAGSVSLAPGRRVGLISQIPVYPDGFTVEDVLRCAFSRTQELGEEMVALSERMAAGDESGETLRRYGELAAKFEGLGGYDTETALNKVAAGLSLDAAMRERLFDTLSGGEKTRVNLGRLILEDTDILLLDEPTNHLDLHAVEWLEEYLASFKGTVLAISHDRYFLDRTVTRCIEVLNGKAEFYSGNYSFYAVEKERRYLEQLRRYEKEQAEIERLSETARSMHEHNTELLHRRAFSIEKRIDRMRATDKPVKARALHATFVNQEFYGDEVFALKGISKRFGGRTLFRGVELQAEGGERIALLGDNGTGKTTLLRLLLGEEYPDEGLVKFGPSVRTAYLPQAVRFDHPERTLVDTLLWSKRGVTTQSARDRLARFHFRGDDVFKRVGVLSGGELSRLYLCLIMDEAVNLLILDEPTNHLDIASREWIEEAVESYDGTLLFVSHDRYFIQRFATRVWDLEDGAITDYRVGFERYRALKADRKKTSADTPAKPASRPAAKPVEHAKRAKRQLTICERDIAAKEAAIAALDGRLEAAGADYEQYAALYEEKTAAEAELEQLMERWEKLAEEAGA